tara:strand:- start:8376 stop:8903 length:528 start_codon:yes stop_codon:yes gene_type:complete
MEYFKNYFQKYNEILTDIEISNFIKLEKLLKNYKNKKKRVFIFGNGGSSSISSHVATDLIKICKIKALNLSDHNLITCFANDYGFENWIMESVKSLVNKEDLVILISSSGQSKNVINAAKLCKINKIKLVTFTGFNKNNKLRKLGDLNFWVNSKKYNFVENIHQTWLLSIVDKIK